MKIGLVSKWNDYSGNDNHVTQGIGSAQPLYVPNTLNGLPVIRFDGNNDYLSFTTELTTMRTVFLVIKHATGDSGGAYHYMFGHSDNYQWAGNSGTLLFSTYADSNIWSEGKIYVNSVDTAPLTIVKPISHTILSIVALWYNPSTPITLTAKYIAGDLPREQYWPGDYVEIIIYNKVLNDTERISVQDYLNLKYAIY